MVRLIFKKFICNIMKLKVLCWCNFINNYSMIIIFNILKFYHNN